MLIFSISSVAQLKVSSNGNVYIGPSVMSNPSSRLSIGSNGSATYDVYINSADKAGAYIIAGNGKTALTLYGSHSSTSNSSTMELLPGGIGGSNNTVSAIHLYAPPSVNGYSYGVKSNYFSLGETLASRAAAIYGSSSPWTGINHDGIYAGYFDGDVRVTGTLYGTLLTPSSSSNTISSVTDRDNGGEIMTELVEGNVSARLSTVQLLQITTHQGQDRFAESINIDDIPRNSDGTIDIEEFEKLSESHKNDVPIQTRMSEKRYGLATDQLKETFPELVYEDANGNVSVNYIEMVPLLVQSVNELQERISVLEDENESLKSALGGDDISVKSRDAMTGIDTSETEVLSLSQNDPNPFSERTTISLTVPEGVSTAAVFFYDMSGKQIAKRVITERGRSQLSVTSGEFGEGMYLYSLIADGKVIATRKMILTK